jgi:hypothetical protein
VLCHSGDNSQPAFNRYRTRIPPLIDEDIEILKKLPRGLPGLHFFRHVEGVSGIKAGGKFGDKYLYKWWKKGCDKLKIDGVDLYGGTRHSSVTALKDIFTIDEIKSYGTLHSTNRAFERYMQVQPGDSKKIYEYLNNTYTYDDIRKKI